MTTPSLSSPVGAVLLENPVDQFGRPFELPLEPIQISVTSAASTTNARLAPDVRQEPSLDVDSPQSAVDTEQPTGSVNLASIFLGRDTAVGTENSAGASFIAAPNRPSFDFEGGTVFPGEPVPATAHYGENAVAIPTLQKLMKGLFEDKPDTLQVVDTKDPDRGSQESGGGTSASNKEEAKKFGLWMGVVVQCGVTIFSVIIYVRMGWVVAQAGIGLTTLIILLSACVTTLTTLSLSAIATNGEVKGGGIYFMMSRALGPEFGGTIGVIYAFASATYVSLNIVGFAEALVPLLPFELSAGGAWDVRIWSIITTFIMLMLVFMGVEAALKFQMLFVGLIGSSLLAYFIGTIITQDDSKGITGYQGSTFSENFKSHYSDHNSFFTIFAVFFPSVTGIMTGSNMSGELKNPRKDIPRGELIAILITTSIYLAISWTVGSVADQNGVDNNGGLQNNLLILKDITIWEPIFYIGLFSASLSSAVGSLITAPRVFQAICNDNLFPVLKIFGKGYGSNNEPVYATLLAFAISIAFILINNLNVISTLVTLFFLISYSIVNYACFVASASSSPGWRPAFKYFHPVTALIGCALTVAVMFLIDWRISLAVLCTVVAIYYYLVYKSPDVNWGSARSAKLYVDTLEMSYKLQAEKKHVKNFRPQLLVLTGSPYDKVQMIKFCSQITGNGVMILENIILGDFSHRREEFNVLRAEFQDYLSKAKVQAFFDVCVAPSYQAGLRSMLQLSGLGGIRPNTVVMGWKNEWASSNQTEINEYVGMIFDSFEFNFGVIVLRDHAELYDFHAAREKRIDIWWLADDGGLTMLLPFLLRKNADWKACRMRLLIIGTVKGNKIEEQARMARLLSRFRIKAEPVYIENSKTASQPLPETLRRHNKLAVRRKKGATPIIPKEITDRLRRYMKIGEIVREHSSDSNTVFITMPVPTTFGDANEYMSMLETMSYGLPPTILLRGNQENVLTYDL